MKTCQKYENLKEIKNFVNTYLIFVLFSPQAKFLTKFFSTPKRVNRNKTDFATKQSKS